ncbi:DUF4238 domain-containing protein [Nocardia rhizosphaerihabitans]|uniref:DUF4238 domain-containing protein n=1 Tax=Nocardia rhizosphaerihabitans TaxID=1691570 RepID=UPI00367329E6
MADLELFGNRDWTVVKSVRNPWGQVPLTAGGQSLSGRSREYMDKLVSMHQAKDTVSRRHHYVPRTYLRQWSSDSKRVWALDTVTGVVKPIGVASVCVEENFYRVVGPDGAAHNRVELLFGVVDAELRRVQTLFNQLRDPDELEFDDLIGLGVTVAVQRMRTVQQRRLRQQHNSWLVAQNPHDFKPIEDSDNPYSAASFHTQLLFSAMWEAADVLTTRQIEVWHDPRGRFMTCDAPVLVPFRRNVCPSLLESPYVIWPISPHRVVALGSDLLGEKAVIREATGKHVGIVREGVERGRERMIFASAEQHDKLPRTKKFRRRIQTRLRCSHLTPQGEYVEAPGCCVEQSHAFAEGPDIALCDQGLHRAAPEMWMHS